MIEARVDTLFLNFFVLEFLLRCIALGPGAQFHALCLLMPRASEMDLTVFLRKAGATWSLSWALRNSLRLLA